MACQKVVHPEVRQFLQSHDVLVLDRLGRVHLELVHNLIGEPGRFGGVLMFTYKCSTFVINLIMIFNFFFGIVEFL